MFIAVHVVGVVTVVGFDFIVIAVVVVRGSVSVAMSFVASCCVSVCLVQVVSINVTVEAGVLLPLVVLVFVLCRSGRDPTYGPAFGGFVFFSCLRCFYWLRVCGGVDDGLPRAKTK